MRASVRIIACTQLESPDAIAELCACDDAGVGEIVQVPVQRDTVEALTIERVDEVCVAEWASALGQDLKHGETRLCHAEAGLADDARVGLLHAHFGLGGHARHYTRSLRRVHYSGGRLTGATIAPASTGPRRCMRA